MTVPATDPTALSLLFHLNSEPWRNEAAYASAGRQERLELAAERVDLPAAEPSALRALLAGRHSARAFAARPLALAAVGELASAAQGIVETVPLPDGSSLIRRTAPSAGGLYPLELHLFARTVTGLDDGIYRYEPRAHALALLERGDMTEALAGALYAFPFVESANLVLAFVARFARTQDKYGPRGYRYILLEAGHLAQNVCLRATELGLTTLCIGGFVDSQVNALLGLRATEAGVVYMLAAGHPG